MLNQLKALLKGYGEEEIGTRAAALSYFTIFSIGPLLFIILGVLGLVLDNASYKQHLLDQLQGLLGPQASQLVNGVLNSQQLSSKTAIAFVIGGVGLLLGAIGIFGQLQRSLNSILHVTGSPGKGWRGFVRVKLAGFALVGLIIFLLAVSLVVSAAITILSTKLHHDVATGFLFGVLDFGISLVILTILMALLYRTLMFLRVSWRVLFKWSLLVGLLFAIGKSLIGLIIGNNGNVSAFGAAGSLVSLLLWIFYAGQIIYIGALGIKQSIDADPKQVTPKYPGSTYRIEAVKRPIGNKLQEDIVSKFRSGFQKGLKPKK